MKRFNLHAFLNTTLLIAFALLVLTGKAFAETPITVQNSQNLTINHASVVKSGATLLATNLGLYKYTNNQIYKVEEQSLSMIDNEPLWQVTQLENLLFLATNTQLIAYNTNTKKSHIVTPNRAFKLKALLGKLYFISQEKLFYFDIQHNKTELAFSDSNNKITDYQVIKPNHYWLVSNERNLIHIINNNLTTNIPLETNIQWLFLDRTNRLWITLDNQLYQLQNNNLKIVNALKGLSVELPISLSNAYFYFLSKGLLYRYQLDNQQTTHFKQNNLTAAIKLKKGIFLAKRNKEEWFQFSDYELNFFENVRLTPDSQLTNLTQYDKVVSHDESLFLLNDNAIWQFHLPSQRLKQLLNYTNLQNLYLQQPGNYLV